eukprot:TRINITY_DN6501_c0_g1_i1.p1 TRINITY_DN6501_c0_g1~~TRINITY_DN6501_c0_g1_i1.p1  ORF type:complete len:1798 (-),score=181.11 TRINITY_DN6501_c0_g1_i1:268-5661(-)
MPTGLRACGCPSRRCVCAVSGDTSRDLLDNIPPKVKGKRKNCSKPRYCGEVEEGGQGRSEGFWRQTGRDGAFNSTCNESVSEQSKGNHVHTADTCVNLEANSLPKFKEEQGQSLGLQGKFKCEGGDGYMDDEQAEGNQEAQGNGTSGRGIESVAGGGEGGEAEDRAAELRAESKDGAPSSSRRPCGCPARKCRCGSGRAFLAQRVPSFPQVSQNTLSNCSFLSQHHGQDTTSSLKEGASNDPSVGKPKFCSEHSKPDNCFEEQCAETAVTGTAGQVCGYCGESMCNCESNKDGELKEEIGPQFSNSGSFPSDPSRWLSGASLVPIKLHKKSKDSLNIQSSNALTCQPLYDRKSNDFKTSKCGPGTGRRSCGCPSRKCSCGAQVPILPPPLPLAPRSARVQYFPPSTPPAKSASTRVSVSAPSLPALKGTSSNKKPRSWRRSSAEKAVLSCDISSPPFKIPKEFSSANMLSKMEARDPDGNPARLEDAACHADVKQKQDAKSRAGESPCGCSYLTTCSECAVPFSLSLARRPASFEAERKIKLSMSGGSHGKGQAMPKDKSNEKSMGKGQGPVLPPFGKKQKKDGPGTGRRVCGCPSRLCSCGAAALLALPQHRNSTGKDEGQAVLDENYDGAEQRVVLGPRKHRKRPVVSVPNVVAPHVDSFSCSRPWVSDNGPKCWSSPPPASAADSEDHVQSFVDERDNCDRQVLEGNKEKKGRLQGRSLNALRSEVHEWLQQICKGEACISNTEGVGWKSCRRQVSEEGGSIPGASVCQGSCLKEAIREAMAELHEVTEEWAVGATSLVDGELQIMQETTRCIQCETAPELENEEGEEVLCCVGGCQRAFHRHNRGCLEPLPSSHHEDAQLEHATWLCAFCACKLECLQSMSACGGQDTNFWEDLFSDTPGTASLADSIPLGALYDRDWPSDDAGDEDYEPSSDERWNTGNTGLDGGVEEVERWASSESSSEAEGDESETDSEMKDDEVNDRGHEGDNDGMATSAYWRRDAADSEFANHCAMVIEPGVEIGVNEIDDDSDLDIEEREKRRALVTEKAAALKLLQSQAGPMESAAVRGRDRAEGSGPAPCDEPNRPENLIMLGKRKRAPVDYIELNSKLFPRVLNRLPHGRCLPFKEANASHVHQTKLPDRTQDAIGWLDSTNPDLLNSQPSLAPGASSSHAAPPTLHGPFPLSPPFPRPTWKMSWHTRLDQPPRPEPSPPVAAILPGAQSKGTPSKGAMSKGRQSMVLPSKTAPKSSSKAAALTIPASKATSSKSPASLVTVSNVAIPRATGSTATASKATVSKVMWSKDGKEASIAGVFSTACRGLMDESFGACGRSESDGGVRHDGEGATSDGDSRERDGKAAAKEEEQGAGGSQDGHHQATHFRRTAVIVDAPLPTRVRSKRGPATSCWRGEGLHESRSPSMGAVARTQEKETATDAGRSVIKSEVDFREPLSPPISGADAPCDNPSLPSFRLPALSSTSGLDRGHGALSPPIDASNNLNAQGGLDEMLTAASTLRENREAMRGTHYEKVPIQEGSWKVWAGGSLDKEPDKESNMVDEVKHPLAATVGRQVNGSRSPIQGRKFTSSGALDSMKREESADVVMESSQPNLGHRKDPPLSARETVHKWGAMKGDDTGLPPWPIGGVRTHRSEQSPPVLAPWRNDTDVGKENIFAKSNTTDHGAPPSGGLNKEPLGSLTWSQNIARGLTRDSGSWENWDQRSGEGNKRDSFPPPLQGVKKARTSRVREKSEGGPLSPLSLSGRPFSFSGESEMVPDVVRTASLPELEKPSLVRDILRRPTSAPA